MAGHPKRSFPRSSGAVYTPAPLARLMVSRVQAAASPNGSAPLRVLDPACGDGVFLQAVQDQVSQSGMQTAVVLYGVDLHQEACLATERRFANQQVDLQLALGCALRGPDFQSRSLHEPLGNTAGGVNWQQRFPEVAAAGGFDLIIGNPPYLRERDAKPLFDELAATPLGQKYRQARMDLWHYFVHRSLDLLRPGGVLSFIVTSYWTASRGAARLIRRLQEETTLLEMIRLGPARIFPGVSGRHLIFTLRKGISAEPCRIVTLPEVISGPWDAQAWDLLAQSLATPSSNGTAAVAWRTREELFRDGSIRWDDPPAPASSAARARSATPLGNLYQVRQGIAENPPRVAVRHLPLLSPGAAVGAGVFVLRREEIEPLGFSAAEMALLRPYFDTVTLDRYHLPAEPVEWLLYLQRETAPSLAPFPHLARHLSRYRPIMEQRRETKDGRIPWWHLHWPRSVALFTEPRILARQMGRTPAFAFVAGRPTFVGFSVNLISARAEKTWTLPALTGLLNSEPAAAWFARHAKQRGIQLDIIGGTLRQFPIPDWDAALDHRLAALVLARQEETLPDGRRSALETKIENLVATCWPE